MYTFIMRPACILTQKEMEKLETKLFEAAAQGSITSLQQLLEDDDPLILDRGLVNRFNETPLHVAAILGHVYLVKEIIRLKPQLVNELNLQLSSPLHLASANGHVDVVKALLSIDSRTCLARDRDGLTPLHQAAIRGRVEAMKTVYRRDASILHLCVEYYQLEALKLLMNILPDSEFINSRDADGNTVLHLAVADKQVETIKFLASVAAVEVNAQNREGLTAVGVLIGSRRDVRDSEIEKSLKTVGGYGSLENNPREMNQESASTPAEKNSWESLMKQHSSWLERKKSALMVVAILIATMAFQVGVNPPGGVWQQDGDSVNSQGNGVSNPQEAGTSVYALKSSRGYRNFYTANAIAFVASLSIILLLTSGLPLRRRFFMWILMVITWIAITAIALCYLAAIIVLTPTDKQNSVVHVTELSIVVWIILMALLLLAHTIRLIVKLIRKMRKAWISRRRRSASSARPEAV